MFHYPYYAWVTCGLFGSSAPRVLIPLNQRLENELWEQPACTIWLCSETVLTEFGLTKYFKMVVSLVFWPLVRENKDSGKEIAKPCVILLQVAYTLTDIYPDPAEKWGGDLMWSSFHCKTLEGNGQFFFKCVISRTWRKLLDPWLCDESAA